MKLHLLQFSPTPLAVWALHTRAAASRVRRLQHFLAAASASAWARLLLRRHREANLAVKLGHALLCIVHAIFVRLLGRRLAGGCGERPSSPKWRPPPL